MFELAFQLNGERLSAKALDRMESKSQMVPPHDIKIWFLFLLWKMSVYSVYTP